MDDTENRTIDRDGFEKLTKGMSYEEVVELLGDEGELMSGHTAQIEPGIIFGSMTTVLREWQYPDGSIIRIMFSNNQLLDKSASPE